MSDLETLRALETANIDADLAWRRAKAERFIELVGEDGELHPVAYKQLEADEALIELEREARTIAANLKVAWKDYHATQKANDRANRQRPFWARVLFPAPTAEVSK